MQIKPQNASIWATVTLLEWNHGTCVPCSTWHDSLFPPIPSLSLGLFPYYPVDAGYYGVSSVECYLMISLLSMRVAMHFSHLDASPAAARCQMSQLNCYSRQFSVSRVGLTPSIAQEDKDHNSISRACIVNMNNQYSIIYYVLFILVYWTLNINHRKKSQYILVVDIVLNQIFFLRNHQK